MKQIVVILVKAGLVNRFGPPWRDTAVIKPCFNINIRAFFYN